MGARLLEIRSAASSPCELPDTALNVNAFTGYDVDCREVLQAVCQNASLMESAAVLMHGLMARTGESAPEIPPGSRMYTDYPARAEMPPRPREKVLRHDS